MFYKIARPEIDNAVAYLCTRVTKSNETDWFNLKRVLRFLKDKIGDTRIMEIDNIGIVSEVTLSISRDMSVNINKLNFDSEDGIFTGLISVSVKNKTILNRLINRILKVKGVDKVLRE